MNLCFQKEKTWRKCVFTTTPYIHIIIYFTSLFYPSYIQIPFIRQISLQGDKNLPLISEMLGFLGTLFIIILTLKIF